MIAFRKLIKKAALIIAVNTLLVSCCLLPVERTWTDEYVIDNNTNHSINICYVFEKNHSEPEIIRDTIKIEPNTEYLESKLDGFHGEAAGIFPIDTDSVVITFDNEREIIQTCEHFFSEDCPVERNIVAYWDEANYVKKVIAKKCKIKAHRYTYTITEEDYNNAVPIEE